MLPKIIIGIVILVVLFFGFQFISGGPRHQPSGNPVTNIPQTNHKSQNTFQTQHESAQFDNKKPFYNQNSITLTHTWPGEKNFSNEETEVLIFNESNSKVEVKSFDLEYMVEGKTYPQKSGTWEKFPSKESWERMEYANISKQYYKGESLILEPNQKGKLHWHIQFGSQPLDGKQIVKFNLTLLKDGQTINIDEEFNRPSGQVFSKSEH